jgi:hypothetical protein
MIIRPYSRANDPAVVNNTVGANNHSPSQQQGERSLGRIIIRPYSRANDPAVVNNTVGANNHSPSQQQGERSLERMIIRPCSRANDPAPAGLHVVGIRGVSQHKNLIFT